MIRSKFGFFNIKNNLKYSEQLHFRQSNAHSKNMGLFDLQFKRIVKHEDQLEQFEPSNYEMKKEILRMLC